MKQPTPQTQNNAVTFSESSSISVDAAATTAPDDSSREVTGDWVTNGNSLPRPVLAGFEILDELGRGGMGVVYRARHKRLGHEVALKMILAGTAADEKDRARFQLEAAAVARLKHAGIVRLHDFGEFEGRPFFSLEFVEGGTLSSRLKSSLPTPRESAEIVQKLAIAMHHAHGQGIIHRDLKPANILLTRDGEPKITDFGLAKDLASDAGLSHTGAMMGTASYMAPEQAEGRNRDIHATTDVYALGAILYECLTGKPPFKGSTLLETLELVRSSTPVRPTTIAANVPKDLETVCLRCLEKDARKRYATAADLADDLGRFLRREPVLARPVGILGQARRWCQRNPTVAVSMLVVTAILTTATAISLHFGLQAQQNAEDEAKARKDADEQTQLAKDAAHEKELQRITAVNATNDRDAEIVKVRNALLTSQLLLVNGKWESDPAAALRLLDDESACPAEYRDFTWKHFRYRTPRELAKWQGPRTGIAAFACSSDGEVVASCGEDGVYLHLSNGRLVARFSEAAERVAFHPVKPIVACAYPSGVILLREYPTGTEVGRLEGHRKSIRNLQFHPSGFQLVSNSLDETVKCWNTTDFQLIGSIAGPKGPLGCAGFRKLPDGTWIIVALDAELGLTVWNPISNESRSFPGGKGTRWKSVISDDGTLLATSLDEAQGGEIGLAALQPSSSPMRDRWSIPRVATMLGHNQPVRSMSFSSDGRALASVDVEGNIKTWDTTRQGGNSSEGIVGPVISFEGSPRDSQVVALHPSKTPQWVLVGGADGSARILGLKPKTPSHLHSKHGWCFALAVSPDGDTVAAGSTYSSDPGQAHIELWNRKTGAAVADFPRHANRLIFQVRFSPDGKVLASSGGDGMILLTDLATRKVQTSLGPGAISYAIAYTADGKYIAAAGDDGQIRLWDLAERKVAHALRGHRGPVRSLTLLSNSTTLVSVGDDGTLRFWDMNSRSLIRSVNAHNQRILWVCATRKGDSIATTSEDGLIKFWNADGKHRLTLSGLPTPANRIEFSPDGKTLASATGHVSTGELRLWDVVNGRTRAVFPRRDDTFGLVFTPDGKTLMLSGFHTVITLLETEAGLVPQAIAPVGAEVIPTRDETIALAQKSEWSLAKTAYQKLMAIGSRDDHIRFEYACLQLLSGDDAGYQQSLGSIIADGEKMSVRAFLAARTATLSRSMGKELVRAVQLSAQELTSNDIEPWAITELAALQVRSGKFEEATVRLRELLAKETKWAAEVVPRLWLCLALHGQKQTDAAKVEYEKAKKQLDQWGKSMPIHPEGPNKLHVHDWLEAQILRREVEALIR